MKPTEWLQAARILGGGGCIFRRCLSHHEEAGLAVLIDKHLTQHSHYRAPVDEVLRMNECYRQRHAGWNVKHFYAWYRRDGGEHSYTWIKNQPHEKGLVKRGKWPENAIFKLHTRELTARNFSSFTLAASPPITVRS